MKRVTAIFVVLVGYAILLPESKSEAPIKTAKELKSKFAEKVKTDALKDAEAVLQMESDVMRADPVPPPPQQGPTITLPNRMEQAKPGFVLIRASSFVADDIRWWSRDIQTLPPEFARPILGSFTGFVLSPGTYTVYAIPAKSIDGKAVIGELTEITVVVGGVVPPVVDPPKPPVVDPVKPVAKGPFWITVFDDYTKRTPASAAVLMSQKVRATAAAGNHSFRLFDGSQVDDAAVLAAYKPWIDKVGGTPCVVVTQKNSVPAGKVVTSFKLPATEDEFDTLIKGLGQ